MRFDRGHIEESAAFIRSKAPFAPEIALVLGSGLGEYAETLHASVVLRQDEIPHYPLSTVAGHRGRLVFGTAGQRRILAFQGRLHYYEAGTVSTALFPIFIAAAVGARILLITNAAGGVNPDLLPGDLMLITDQLNLTGEAVSHPGPEAPRGTYFDPQLIRRVEEAAVQAGIRVRKGVYAGVKGPSYETAAEVAMVRRLGGDAVGMSTVLEVALAGRLGMKVLGVSCITNKATGVGSEKLSHEEVSEVAGRVRAEFSRLLDAVIQVL